MGVQVPPFAPTSPYHLMPPTMSQPNPVADAPALTTTQTSDYRDRYANSVQVRISVWDFFLIFGTMHQDRPEEVRMENFQGIYVSPQQAKALFNILGHNLAQYEQTFGPIALEPQLPVRPSGGPVH